MSWSDDVQSRSSIGLAGMSAGVGAVTAAWVALLAIAIALLKHRWWRSALLILCGIIVCAMTLLYATGKTDGRWWTFFVWMTFGCIFLPVLLAADHYRREEKEQAKASTAHSTTDPRMRRLTEAAEQFGLDRC